MKTTDCFGKHTTQQCQDSAYCTSHSHGLISMIHIMPTYKVTVVRRTTDYSC